MNEIYIALQQAGYFVASHLLELVLGLGLLYFRKWTGIQIEEKHMRVLQSAVLNGVRLGIEGNLTGERLRQAALDYIKQSAPDAINSLGVKGSLVLEKLVQAKIQEVKTDLEKPK